MTLCLDPKFPSRGAHDASLTSTLQRDRNIITKHDSNVHCSADNFTNAIANWFMIHDVQSTITNLS